MSMSWDTLINDFAAYQRAASLSTRTIALRSWWLRRLATDAGVAPDAITHRHLVTWLADNDWSVNTRRSASNTARVFFRWAADEGVIVPNPAARLPRVRAPKGAPRPVDEALFTASLQSASGRDALMLELAGRLGLRRAEIAQLRREDVTAIGLRVRGKGDRVRVLPLTPQLQAALTARAEGWLFPGRFQGHMHPDAVGKAIRRALRFESSAHPLRHRFACRAYRGTHDLLALRQALGHGSVATTEIYTLADADGVAACVAAAQ